MAVVGMRIYPGTQLFERAVAEGQISATADLLQPAYYLAPGLTEAAVFAQLQEFARLSPNWIVGDPSPEYQNLVKRLRQRGVVGPLWGYFALLQRIQPQTVDYPEHETSAADLPCRQEQPDGQEFQFPAARPRAAEVAALTPAGWQVTIRGRKGGAAGFGAGGRSGGHHHDDGDRRRGPMRSPTISAGAASRW